MTILIEVHKNDGFGILKGKIYVAVTLFFVTAVISRGSYLRAMIGLADKVKGIKPV